MIFLGNGSSSESLACWLETKMLTLGAIYPYFHCYGTPLLDSGYSLIYQIDIEKT